MQEAHHFLFGTPFASLIVPSCLCHALSMHRFVNPLLLDSSAALREAAERTAAPKMEAKVEGAAFAEELASVQEKAPAPPIGAPAAATEKTEPTPVSTPAQEGVEDSDFTFDDFVDIINPLHHIPIVGAIYRYFSEDTIKPASRVIGDMAFGAMTGSFIVSGIVSVIGAAIEQSTGISPEVQVANALFGPDDNQPRPERIEVASDERSEDLPERAEDAPPVEDSSMMLAAATSPSLGEEGEGEVRIAPPLLVPATENGKVASAEPAAKAPFGGVMPPVLRTAEEAPSPLPKLPSAPPASQAVAANLAPGESQPLPPDFVRDMMAMALHKYQTANRLAPGSMSVPATN